MIKKKYVDFVNNTHFEKCVKHVCNSYSMKTRSDKELQKNGIDPIKMTFDMKHRKLDFEKWRTVESDRQNDKTVNNAIGEFHQMLLGGVKGWTNLGVGDDSGLDLKKDDDTIFVEIKNKDNDINGNVEMSLRRKLYDQCKKTPNATCYFAYVSAKNKKSEIKDWKPSKRAKKEKRELDHDNIKRISGSKIYSLVTGKDNALEQVWRALPSAIMKTCKKKHKMSKRDVVKFESWFNLAYVKPKTKK